MKDAECASDGERQKRHQHSKNTRQGVLTLQVDRTSLGRWAVLHRWAGGPGYVVWQVELVMSLGLELPQRVSRSEIKLGIFCGIGGAGGSLFKLQGIVACIFCIADTMYA